MPAPLLAPLLVPLLAAATATADIAADPAAEKAFAEFVAAYRSHPSLVATPTTTVSARDRSVPDAVQSARGNPVEIRLVHGRVEGEGQGGAEPAPRRGMLTCRGYSIWFGDGHITATHESNPDAYWRVGDNGSAYYALLSMFFDLPYPDVALAIGEDAPMDVLMQLHPTAPDMVPVAVSDETADGAQRRTFRLAGEGQEAELVIDSARGLPLTMKIVQSGAAQGKPELETIYEHAFRYEVSGKPLTTEAVTFDPGQRQKVDAFAALIKARAPELAERGQGGGHAIVGTPLPDLQLPLLQGGTLDLGAPQNRVLVLDFWATWCGPCKASLPKLHEMAADFRREDLPVAFYTVNVFERTEDLQARRDLIGGFWGERKYTLPVALDLDGAAGRAFQVPGIPMTVVVRSDGVIHAVNVGFSAEKLESDIRGAIKALEAAPKEPEEGKN